LIVGSLAGGIGIGTVVGAGDTTGAIVGEVVRVAVGAMVLLAGGREEGAVVGAGEIVRVVVGAMVGGVV
jgi:hypothetical protein